MIAKHGRRNFPGETREETRVETRIEVQRGKPQVAAVGEIDKIVVRASADYDKEQVDVVVCVTRSYCS